MCDKPEAAIAISKISVEFRGFFLTSKVLYAYLKNQYPSSVMFPHAVNTAFACEIGLKLILAYEEIGYGATHELSALVAKLPSSFRSELYAKVTSLYPEWRKDDFALELAKVSKVFVYARYTHECTYAYDPRFLDALMDAINSILGRYPAYEIVETRDALDEEDFARFFETEDWVTERDIAAAGESLDWVQEET